MTVDDMSQEEKIVLMMRMGEILKLLNLHFTTNFILTRDRFLEIENQALGTTETFVKFVKGLKEADISGKGKRE